MALNVVAIETEPAGTEVRGARAARQREFGRQVSHVGMARQKAHHVDMVGDRAVRLDHARRRQACAACDLGQIRRDAVMVKQTGMRHCRPEPSAGAQSRQQRRQPLLQLPVRHHERVVVDRQRPKRGHDLHDPGNGSRRHPLGQCQHQRVHVAVHPVAKLDRERRVAARQEPRRDPVRGAARGAVWGRAESHRALHRQVFYSLPGDSTMLARSFEPGSEAA